MVVLCFFLLQIFGACATYQHAKHQRRNLSIHEYQAMDLLNKFGVRTPSYKVAESASEVEKIANDLGTFCTCNSLMQNTMYVFVRVLNAYLVDSSIQKT